MIANRCRTRRRRRTSRGGGGGTPNPENLPVRSRFIDLPVAQKQGLVNIRKEITKQIESHPHACGVPQSIDELYEILNTPPVHAWPEGQIPRRHQTPLQQHPAPTSPTRASTPAVAAASNSPPNSPSSTPPAAVPHPLWSPTPRPPTSSAINPAASANPRSSPNPSSSRSQRMDTCTVEATAKCRHHISMSPDFSRRGR